jgi:hypothetical protein
VSAGSAEARRSLRLVVAQRETVTIELGSRTDEGSQRAMGSPAEPPDGPTLTGPIALGAVGVAALVVFGVAAGLGASEYADLEETCAPRCTTDQTDPIDAKLVAADIALAIGSTALAGGLIWLAVELADAPTPKASPAARGVVVRF